ncbi:RecX family transcriptional regulator [Patescibacteria group bacterium]|nr:RecX family transcriptional regulator [Patescibacteria group bacterium]
MPLITAIKPQKKGSWYNLFIDGKFLFSLPSHILLGENLKTGDDVSFEKIEELVKKNEFSAVLDKVLRFLSYRPRSQFEIEKYFEKNQVGEHTQKLVKEKLFSLKLIDDEAFVRWWIEQRTQFRLKSKHFIMAELRLKGIPKELIIELLPEERTKEDEFSVAEKIALKKLERIKSLPEIEKKKKLYNLLSQRGFSYEVVKQIVDKVLERE